MSVARRAALSPATSPTSPPGAAAVEDAPPQEVRPDALAVLSAVAGSLDAILWDGADGRYVFIKELRLSGDKSCAVDPAGNPNAVFSASPVAFQAMWRLAEAVGARLLLVSRAPESTKFGGQVRVMEVNAVNERNASYPVTTVNTTYPLASFEEWARGLAAAAIAPPEPTTDDHVSDAGDGEAQGAIDSPKVTLNDLRGRPLEPPPSCMPAPTIVETVASVVTSVVRRRAAVAPAAAPATQPVAQATPVAQEASSEASPIATTSAPATSVTSRVAAILRRAPATGMRSAVPQPVRDAAAAPAAMPASVMPQPATAADEVKVPAWRRTR